MPSYPDSTARAEPRSRAGGRERGPDRRLYRITKRGERALKGWLETVEPGDRDGFYLKSFLGSLMSREALVGHYRQFRALTRSRNSPSTSNSSRRTRAAATTTTTTSCSSWASSRRSWPSGGPTRCWRSSRNWRCPRVAHSRRRVGGRDGQLRRVEPLAHRHADRQLSPAALRPKAWASQCRFAAPRLSSCSRRDIRRRRRCRPGPPAGASASGCPAGRHRSSSTGYSVRRRSAGTVRQGALRVDSSASTGGGCRTGAGSGSTPSATDGRLGCWIRRSPRPRQPSSTRGSSTPSTRCKAGDLRDRCCPRHTPAFDRDGDVRPFDAGLATRRCPRRACHAHAAAPAGGAVPKRTGRLDRGNADDAGRGGPASRGRRRSRVGGRAQGNDGAGRLLLRPPRVRRARLRQARRSPVGRCLSRRARRRVYDRHPGQGRRGRGAVSGRSARCGRCTGRTLGGEPGGVDHAPGREPRGVDPLSRPAHLTARVRRARTASPTRS